MVIRIRYFRREKCDTVFRCVVSRLFPRGSHVGKIASGFSRENGISIAFVVRNFVSASSLRISSETQEMLCAIIVGSLELNQQEVSFRNNIQEVKTFIFLFIVSFICVVTNGWRERSKLARSLLTHTDESVPALNLITISCARNTKDNN